MYYIVYALLWLVSLLPLRVLYVLADLLCPVVHHLVRYRLKVVRENLATAFPEKSARERRQIEARFYRWFCDLFVESVKLFSMSRRQMMLRMTFGGLEHVRQYHADGQQLVFSYLGHLGNWEWIASLQYWLPEVHCTQIYHKLYNKVANDLFLHIRQQYGGECINMRDTYRRLLELKRTDNTPVIVGFIADQQPKWNAIHHFTPFLHHDTAVFIGTEHIAKKLNAAVVYARVTRPRRGYYHCEFLPMTNRAADYPDYALTDQYMRMLEADIQSCPHLWLWSHKRWSRTKEEWLARQAAAHSSSSDPVARTM